MSIKRFTLTDEQYAKIIEASKPTPVMYLSGGESMFRSPQENANAAWQSLGNELGFIWDSVRPVHGEPKQFDAEVKNG